MPELPEVETTLRGIEPYCLGQNITAIKVRQKQLRWPIPEELQQLVGQRIQCLGRRAKYLMIHTDTGTGILHLGMSGSMRVCAADLTPEKHDHVDICLSSGQCVRFRDPRRFGAFLYQAPGTTHQLLKNLGPEPLGDEFTGQYLRQRAKGKKQAIKLFLMNNAVVVGVGNIYASEALHKAGVDPRKPAEKLSHAKCKILVECIRTVLASAIKQGGTTLKDFAQANGQSGYFQVALKVYGRKDEPCLSCGTTIQQIKQGQRSTWFCPKCQR